MKRWALALGAIATMLAVGVGSAHATLPEQVGFNIHSFVRNTDAERELQLARAAGADVVRIDILWSQLEPVRDDRYHADKVERLDTIMNAARQEGLEVLAIALKTPCWASTAPRNLFGQCRRDFADYPPRDPAEYGEFVRWLTDRYGDVLTGVQVWNEPNVRSKFRTGAAVPDYVELVRAAHDARTNGVRIFAGSLHNDGEQAFQANAYENGIAGSFDVWTTHLYGARVAQLVDRLQEEWGWHVAYGSTPPVWVAEFGWATCTPKLLDLHNLCPSSVRVGMEKQGRLLANAFDRLGDIAYVEGATSYELTNGGWNAGDSEHNYGILFRSLREKPSYAWVRDCLRSLAPCGGG